MLLENGADHVFIETGSIADDVRKVFPNGVNKVLELVGTSTLTDSLRCSAIHGTVCMTGMVGESWEFEKFSPMGVIPSAVNLTEGLAGLRDRSSRPNASPNKTPDGIEAKVIALRKERRIYHRIAAETGVSKATVGRILIRHGLNRWRDLEPAEPVRRYERDKPGEMIHLDIKKLGRFNKVGHRITGDRTGQSNSRGVGWEYVHVCIDDHSRIAFADIRPTRKRKAPLLPSRQPSPGTPASASPSSGS